MSGRSKRWVFVALVAAVSMLGGAVAQASLSARATSFPDVPAGAFYSAAVQWAADNGITTGVGDTGLFQPEANVTRGQMATFLERLNDLLEAKIATTASELRTEIAAGVAEAEGSSLPRGAIRMNASTAGAETYAFGTAATIEHYGGYIVLSTSGGVLVPLPGPASIGAVDYVLQSVEYCTGLVSNGTITRARVLAVRDTLASSITAADNQAPLTGVGCLTMDLGSVVSNPELVLDVDVASGAVRLARVTTTWVPAGEFAPAAIDLAPAEQESDREG